MYNNILWEVHTFWASACSNMHFGFYIILDSPVFGSFPTFSCQIIFPEPGNPPHASDKSDALLNPIKAAQKKWTRKQAQMSNNDEVNIYRNLTKLAV